MSFGTVQAEKMTTESGYSLGAGNASSFKNRIINGAMVINQRFPGSTITLDTSQNYQFLDRYRFVGGFAGFTNTVAQSSTAPDGFSTSLVWSNTASGGTITSGSYNSFWQNIEGYNIADWNWGTATAKTITLSFWVRSGVAGTYGVVFTNGTNYYVGTYTVNSANTWEFKSITVPGATTGTWNTTNGTGLTVKWDMGVGSLYNASAGSWGTGNIWGLTGGVKFVETNSVSFYITGVQVEVGTVATSFDYRPYGTELALCQRYFWKSTSTNSGNARISMGCAFSTTATSQHSVMYPVEMRATPTINSLSGNYIYNPVDGGYTVTGINLDGASSIGTCLSTVGSSGLTAQRSYSIFNATINFSAEL